MKKGFYHTRLSQDKISYDEIAEIQRFWNQLKVDQYLQDEYKYRFRRYSKFKYHYKENKLTDLGVTYYQEKKYNDIYGGKNRIYTAIDSTFKDSTYLHELIRDDYLFFLNKNLLDEKDYEIGVHQIRTITQANNEGVITPEGIHKDGHPVFAIHLVNKQNSDGGKTVLYDNDMNKLYETTLKSFGETIFIDDGMLYHEVTPISSKSTKTIGFRDVMIIEFY